MGNRAFATARRWTTALLVAGMGLAGSASATLMNRGPDLVYDDVLDITWTRNANMSGIFNLNWANANAWADNLVFAGFDDWRLPYASVSARAGPTTTVIDCNSATEAACRDNEMGYMFYHNLGGSFLVDRVGTQTAIGGEVLTDIQPIYWSGTGRDSDAPNGHAWRFFFRGGFDSATDPFIGYRAWAVRDGDVPAVPEPATLALLGLGLAGLGFSRRKH